MLMTSCSSMFFYAFGVTFKKSLLKLKLHMFSTCFPNVSFRKLCSYGFSFGTPEVYIRHEV